MQFSTSRSARVLLIGLIWLIAVLQAQAQTLSVFGTITYQNNQPAKNVFVSIARKAAYTDDRGRYRIDDVPVGIQEMVISRGGWALLRVPVSISNSTRRIDKKLP